jgi:hypothetical protein
MDLLQAAPSFGRVLGTGFLEILTSTPLGLSRRLATKPLPTSKEPKKKADRLQSKAGPDSSGQVDT